MRQLQRANLATAVSGTERAFRKHHHRRRRPTIRAATVRPRHIARSMHLRRRRPLGIGRVKQAGAAVERERSDKPMRRESSRRGPAGILTHSCGDTKGRRDPVEPDRRSGHAGCHDFLATRTCCDFRPPPFPGIGIHGLRAVNDPVKDGAPAVNDPVKDGAPAVNDPVQDGAPRSKTR